MSRVRLPFAGHGVLDVEDMLGMRVDAHPASQTDRLDHYAL